MGKTDDLGTLRGYEIIEDDHIIIEIDGETHEVDILDVVDIYEVRVKVFSQTDNHVYPDILLDPDEEYEVWGS